ncbi:MAG TPA: cytochrome c peroxidase, partial [Coriobacteriia bacterium]
MTPRAKRTLQVVGLLAVLALLLPITNLLTGPPSGTPLTAVAAKDAATVKVAHTLERSCANCHVPGVKTPFYAKLPIASTIVERDVKAGLRNFDLARGFATAATGPVPEPVVAMIEREVKESAMPPLPFVAMHWNARLDAGERRAILDWAQNARAAQAAPGVPELLRSQVIRPLPAKLDHDPAKAALGRKLYHDKRLSGDDTLSCASCHDLAKGGTDNETYSDGIRKQKGGINAPTTFNAALNFVQYWDGRAPTLEAQAGGPPLNPVEMGSSGWPQIVEKLNKDKALRKEFEAIYPEGVSEKTITGAIAEFERTLLTPNSRFDRFLAGDEAALSAPEKHGYEVFVAKGCASCHVGELLGGKSFEVMGRRTDYFGARRDVMTGADDGRYNVTKNDADRHYFKVPTLRNVARTSPYFHDGSKRTLPGAVDAMATYQLGAPLREDDLNDVVRFLETLTGEYDGKA